MQMVWQNNHRINLEKTGITYPPRSGTQNVNCFMTRKNGLPFRRDQSEKESASRANTRQYCIGVVSA
jgi:hypothetical protein